METSKDLFMMMRDAEIQTHNFLPTKKELKKTSTEFVKTIVDSGNYNIQEVFAQALRLKESLSTIESELKNYLPDEDFEAFGLKGKFRSGGDTINYKDDEKWLELKNHLSHRESLLKTALESDIDFYDEGGVQVPKVSKTPRKSSLAITF